VGAYIHNRTFSMSGENALVKENEAGATGGAFYFDNRRSIDFELISGQILNNKASTNLMYADTGTFSWHTEREGDGHYPSTTEIKIGDHGSTSGSVSTANLTATSNKNIWARVK
jgi:hypothetical protein